MRFLQSKSLRDLPCKTMIGLGVIAATATTPMTHDDEKLLHRSTQTFFGFGVVVAALQFNPVRG